MITAYILVLTQVGRSADVATSIRALPGVESSDDVTGPYDVIVRACAADINELGQLVVSRIQAIDGIDRTLTCPVVSL
ncbi:Lrp/AsnC ligand binding domain-containing protein [soil metagenome]